MKPERLFVGNPRGKNVEPINMYEFVKICLLCYFHSCIFSLLLFILNYFSLMFAWRFSLFLVVSSPSKKFSCCLAFFNLKRGEGMNLQKQGPRAIVTRVVIKYHLGSWLSHVINLHTPQATKKGVGNTRRTMKSEGHKQRPKKLGRKKKLRKKWV